MSEFLGLQYRVEFEELLIKSGIKNFKWYEVLNCHPDGRLKVSVKGSLNLPPDPKIWPRCIPILRLLELYRASNINNNNPIKVNSFWRCKDYNKDVGGIRKSLHREFRAGDFDPIHSSTNDLWNWILNKIECERQKWQLQKYGTFVHVGFKE